MIKFLSLITVFLLLAGGILAVGINSTSPLPNCVKTKAKVTVTKPVIKDVFKARYWIIASLFKF